MINSVFVLCFNEHIQLMNVFEQKTTPKHKEPNTNIRRNCAMGYVKLLHSMEPKPLF